MKKRKIKSVVALLAAGLLTMSSNAGIISILKRGSADAENPEPAKSSQSAVSQRVAFVGCAEVKAVHGKVEKLCGVEKWQTIQPGAHLEPGDVIRTAEGDVVLEMCESSSLVKVTPATVMRLVPLRKSWDRSSLSGNEEQPGCQVRAVEGRAYFKHGDEAWQPVVVNSVIPVGALIRVAGQGRVCLFDNTANRAVSVAGNSTTRVGGAEVLTVTLSAPR